MSLNSFYNTPPSDVFNIEAPIPRGTIAEAQTIVLDPPSGTISGPNKGPVGPVTDIPSTIAAPQMQRYPGPLHREYTQTNGANSINEDGDPTGSANMGYITVDTITGPGGKPTKQTNIHFNKNLLAPDANGVVDQQVVTRQRMLALMADSIDSGHSSMIKNVTESEQNESNILFATDKNKNSMPAITKAYALFKRSVDNTYHGGNDEAVNGYGEFFRDRNSDKTPGQFMASGDVQEERTVLQNNYLANREELAKIRTRAVTQIDTPDPDIQVRLQALNADLSTAQDESKRISDSLGFPGYAQSSRGIADKAKAVQLGHEITNITAQIGVQSALVSLANSKREAQLANATRDSLNYTTISKEIESEAGDIAATEKAGETKKRFIGSNPGDSDKYVGMVSAGFDSPVFRSFSTREDVYDNNGRKTGMTQITKVNPLDVPDFLINTHNFTMLAAVGNKMPKKEELESKETGVDVVATQYKGFIHQLQELYKGNEDIASKGGVVAKTAYKLFYDGAASNLATMGQMQKSLVGKIRVPFEGPGKMSNFEFQQLLENIPNPTDLLQTTDRVRARLKAITLIGAIDYINKQTTNGLKPTAETFRQMNKQLKPVLGKDLTPADFDAFYNNSQAIGAQYDELEKSGDTKAMKELAAKHINSVFDLLKVNPKHRSAGGLDTK